MTPDYIEEILWELDDFYLEHPLIERAWRELMDHGFLSGSIFTKLQELRLQVHTEEGFA